MSLDVLYLSPLPLATIHILICLFALIYLCRSYDYPIFLLLVKKDVKPNTTNVIFINLHNSSYKNGKGSLFSIYVFLSYEVILYNLNKLQFVSYETIIPKYFKYRHNILINSK